MLKHTNIIGDMSETLVRGYLISQGFEVFLPASGHSRADLIYLDLTGKPVKVQVKTATLGAKTNTDHLYEQCVLARTHSGQYSRDEIYEFWVVGTHLWCFPFHVLGDKTTISLGTTNSSPRKTVRTYDPNDYIVVKGCLESPFRSRLFQDCEEPFLAVSNNEYNPSTIRKMSYQ